MTLAQRTFLRINRRPGQLKNDPSSFPFKIKKVLDAVILIVGISTLLALLLVFSLSLRLRQREIDTIFKLGCSRATTVHLLLAEALIIVGISALFCTAILLLTSRYDEALVRYLLM